MIKRIIGYLAVLILTIYLFFMYNDTVISGLLIFVIMYPLFIILVFDDPARKSRNRYDAYSFDG